MLAVHRQQLHAVLCHGLGHQVAARNKALLVGKGQIVAALNGGQAGTQTGDAHHTVQHHIGAVHGGQLLQALGAGQQPGGVGTARQRRVQPGGGIGVGHADIPGVELLDLLQDLLHMAVGGKAEHLIPLGTDNIQALGADGTGRTQQRDFFKHKLPPAFSDRKQR